MSQSGDGDDKPHAKVESEARTKLIRIVTVIAYAFSVSVAAIILSAYYLFLWRPKNSNHAFHAALVNAPAPCPHSPDPIVMERLSKQIKQQMPVVMPVDARPTPAQVEKQSTRKANDSNHRKHQKNQPPDDDSEKAKIETEYSDLKNDRQSSND